MTSQKPLFPAVREFIRRGQAAQTAANEVLKKHRGMEAAAGKNDEQLAQLREIAEALGVVQATVSMNDVRDEVDRQGIELHEGNWMGSVFKQTRWRRVGFTMARHKGSHARMIGVWKLHCKGVA